MQEQSRHRTDITTLRLLEELGEHEVRSLLTSHPLHCTLYVATVESLDLALRQQYTRSEISMIVAFNGE